MLESIRAAVAIYGPDKRLKFFNSAFAAMWGSAEDWLAAHPPSKKFWSNCASFAGSRKLPISVASRMKWLRKFTSLIEPQQELMHLPDGRTLLLSISPHPFGGLPSLRRRHGQAGAGALLQTLTQVRRATLDHLFEGIAVYGSDGRLKLYNPAYLAIWGLSQDDVAGEPHIATMVEKTRAFLDDSGDWPAIKQRIVTKSPLMFWRAGLFTEPTARSSRKRQCRFRTETC